MRKLRPWLMLLLALSSGGLAAYLALRYLRQQSTPLMASEPRRSQVVLAARDLPVGHVVTEQDIKVVGWPAEAVPTGFVATAEAAVGHGLITPVKLNEPLLDTKIAAKGSGGGLPIVITEGMRAISVRVDDVIGVAGFVVPGTRVDVLLTLGAQADKGETSTKLILQNVQALAAGQSIEKEKDGSPQTVTVITVLVTPDQAETLALAANQGKIQMALRNTMDTVDVRTDGARTSALLGLRPAATATRPNRGRTNTAPPPRAAETVIEGYNGGVRTLLKF
jgi:pilus assembly protein CpaB